MACVSGLRPLPSSWGELYETGGLAVRRTCRHSRQSESARRSSIGLFGGSPHSRIPRSSRRNLTRALTDSRSWHLRHCATAVTQLNSGRPRDAQQSRSGTTRSSRGPGRPGEALPALPKGLQLPFRRLSMAYGCVRLVTCRPGRRGLMSSGRSRAVQRPAGTASGHALPCPSSATGVLIATASPFARSESCAEVVCGLGSRSGRTRLPGFSTASRKPRRRAEPEGLRQRLRSAKHLVPGAYDACP